MRLEPSEEAMYRRMDLKDHLLIVILIMGFIASLSFFLLANPNSQEIELLIKDKAGSGFYIRILQPGESVIKGSQDKRRTMHISRFGYSEEEIETIYEVLKERVLQTATVYEYTE